MGNSTARVRSRLAILTAFATAIMTTGILTLAVPAQAAFTTAPRWEDTTVLTSIIADGESDEDDYSDLFGEGGMLHGVLVDRDEVIKALKDLPRGHWEYTDVVKTRKQTVLENGNLVSKDVPYTAKVRSNYVMEDYYITYKGLVDGSSAPTVSTFKYDTPTFDLGKATDTPEWLFEGWYTGENGTGKKVVRIEQLTKADITVYAHYVPNFYIVRFSSNGGDGILNDIKVKRNSEVTLPVAKMAKTGYNFVGWNTKPDRTGNMYIDQARINNLTFDNDISLYAQYDPISYMVSFNPNGGSGLMQTQTVLYGSHKALTPSAMSKDGMLFTGWNTQPDGSGEWFADTGTVHNLVASEKEVVTLFAQYSADPDPFAAMTAKVFSGDSIVEDFDPMTTSYNLDGMPQQIAVSEIPANYAVESVETGGVIEERKSNTVDKVQQTLVRIRYYGQSETKERVYKFNWRWTEGTGSSFGQELTTVPVFKHGISYPAGNYIVGAEIESGSYLIEHGANAAAVLLTKAGDDRSYAMRDNHSYDLDDKDNVSAEIEFYLIPEFNTSGVVTGEVTTGVLQSITEAELCGDGLYVVEDPIQRFVPALPDTIELTSIDTVHVSPEQKTNPVIEEVKQAETPDYIQDEIDSRMNMTYEIVDTSDVNSGNAGKYDDVEAEAYLGTWTFEALTAQAMELLADEDVEKADAIAPQYSDMTYYGEQTRTINDFLEARNEIEVMRGGRFMQTFSYADGESFESPGDWEAVLDGNKVAGIRLKPDMTNGFSVTASIISGKLVLDKTAFYASIFKKTAEAPEPQGPSMSAQSDDGGSTMSAQSVPDYYGFISPYSVITYALQKHLAPPAYDPDPPAKNENSSSNSNSNSNSNVNTGGNPAVNSNSGTDGTPGNTGGMTSQGDDSGSGSASNTGDGTTSPGILTPQGDGSGSGSGQLAGDSGSPEDPGGGSGNGGSGTTTTPQQTADPSDGGASGGDPAPDTAGGAKDDPAPSSTISFIKPDKPRSQEDVELAEEIAKQEDVKIPIADVIKQVTEAIGARGGYVRERDLVDAVAAASEAVSNHEELTADEAKTFIETATNALVRTNAISKAKAEEVTKEAKKGIASEYKEKIIERAVDSGLKLSRAFKANNDNFYELDNLLSGTEDPQSLTAPSFNRIENLYQNFNAANAVTNAPDNGNKKNSNANEESELEERAKGSVSGRLGENGLIAKIASNDVFRAGVVGLPILIIVLIAAFMLTREQDE